jgi:flagellar hook-length control protein FliK
VPHVASKASVLQSQHSGSSQQRDRMPEAKSDDSPFSILLADTGSAPAPTRYQSWRAQNGTSSQRSDAPRTDAQRPRRPDDNGATDPTADAAATGQTEGAAEPIEVAGTADAPQTGATVSTPAAEAKPATDKPATEEPAIDEPATPDAALAAVVETPVTPPPQPTAAADPTLLALAPAPVAAEAPAETGAETPATGAIAPVAPDAVAAIEPALPQAPQTAQAPQVVDQHVADQQVADQPAQQVPTVPQAKPSGAPAVSADTDDLSQPSATAEATVPAPSTADSESTEANAAPQNPTDAATPTQTSSRPQGPDAPERPHPANPVNEFVQAANPTPDSSHLAHLQSGRDFGQSVAATAQASQDADASNPLASAPVPLESLAVEIASRALPGRSRFEIRLDPPELGRIDVRLDIDRSGNVTSRLVVEKAETLDVLRRDAHQLERALQDAGLKTSDNGMQFSLRDQAFAERHGRGESHGTRTLIADPELPATEGAATAYGLSLRGGSGIDIRV